MSVPIVVRGGILATNGTQLPLDTFSRVRTSLPVPHVLNLNVRSSSGYVMDGSVTGSATIVLNNTNGTPPAPTVSLTATGAVATSQAVRQSYTRVNYVPGISRYYLFTSILKDATNTAFTGLTALNQAYTRVGPYDNSFGLFWQYDKFTDKIYVGILQDGLVVSQVAQDAFNVNDLTNITGLSPTSPVTVDFTKMQVLYIDQEWLGVGAVRFGVYVENTLVIAHVFTNVNALVKPYTATPNYPLRHEVYVTAAATGTLKYTECCSACLNDEGTIPLTLPPTCVVLAYTTLDAVTLASPTGSNTYGLETAMLAIRPTSSPSGIMNGINSFITIRSIQGTVLSTSDIVLLRVYRVFSHLGQSALGRVNYGSVTGGSWSNATATAPNFGDTGYPLGLMEVNSTISTSFTQGILIATITATTSNTGLRFDPGAVPFGVALDGTADIVLITASAGTNAPRLTVGFEWAQPT